MKPNARRLARALREALTGDDATAILQAAMRVLEERSRFGVGLTLTTPSACSSYFRMRLNGLEHEEFHVAYLDAQNQLIDVESLFRGTLSQTSVYPREIVKRALAHNAAAVIFAHNHPSGVAEPSRSDEALTAALRQALALVDVKVLDHFVIGRESAMSFAERGLL